MTTTEPDIHTTAGKLADLRRRAEETLHPVGEAAVEKTHARGKLTARERILALLTTTRSSNSTRWPATARRPSTRRRTARSATASSPATAPSTAARSASSARTPPCSAAASARSTARRSSKCRNCHQDRPPADRHQRRRRRAHPGGWVSLGLYSRIFHNNISGLRRHPADPLIMEPAGGHVYSPADRLRHHGRPDQPDVHHRSRRHQDRHR